MSVFFEKKGSAIYFLLCMFVFSFFVYSGNIKREFIDFPHFVINTLPIYFVLAIDFFFVVALFFSKKNQIDFIAILLAIRLILHLFSIKNGEISPFFGINFTTSLLCLCTYLIALNQSKSYSFLIKIFCLFFIVLTVQIFFEAVLGTESFWGNVYLYKHDLTLPIGSSNALASKIIPFYAILYSVFQKKTYHVILTVLSLIIVVLTKSRGGFFDLLLVFIFLKSWEGLTSIRFVFRSIIIASLLFVMVFLSYTSFDSSMLLFSDSDSTIVGRLGLWENGINIFKDNILFGVGFYEGYLANNPHNFVIDILMRSGIVGLFVFLLIFCSIFFNVKPFFKDSYVRGCTIALFCMMWQGLVEVVLFSYIHDVIMWVIVGSMISRVNDLKNGAVLL